jgi:ABC-type bacteriocin/lantibiotic exporter with double-glycine peptidase domain
MRLKVPVVRQDERTTCGLCVVTMLARYYGMPVDAEDVERVRRLATAEEGASGGLLAEVLKANGFDAAVFRGELLDEETPRGIAYHLRRGRPVVVMVSLRGKRSHYMVVTGHDPAAGRVFLADPAGGSLSCSSGAFVEMWERCGRFALLAVPRREPGGALLRSRGAAEGAALRSLGVVGRRLTTGPG